MPDKCGQPPRQDGRQEECDDAQAAALARLQRAKDALHERLAQPRACKRLADEEVKHVQRLLKDAVRAKRRWRDIDPAAIDRLATKLEASVHDLTGPSRYGVSTVWQCDNGADWSAFTKRRRPPQLGHVPDRRHEADRG